MASSTADSDPGQVGNHTSDFAAVLDRRGSIVIRVAPFLRASPMRWA